MQLSITGELVAESPSGGQIRLHGNGNSVWIHAGDFATLARSRVSVPETLKSLALELHRRSGVEIIIAVGGRRIGTIDQNPVPNLLSRISGARHLRLEWIPLLRSLPRHWKHLLRPGASA